MLLDDYLREFAELEGSTVSRDSTGHIVYEWFDAYWTEDARLPFWIRADRAIAGLCLLRQVGQAGEIAEFYVVPALRRQGIGAAAVSALASVCRARDGQRCLIARVRKWNEPAIAFWTAQGFDVRREDADDVVTSLDLDR